MSENTIINLVYSAIDEINMQLPKNQQLDKALTTCLFGENGKLDSLGLVNFIVTTEQKIEDELGQNLTLADEKAMSQKNSPFTTIGSFINYIETALQESVSG